MEEPGVFGKVAEPQCEYGVSNKEMNIAWDFLANTGVSVFLTGKAGTGKTTFLRKLRELMPKRMVVLAPTGVAAINAGGQTIHSFFQFSFSPFIPGALTKDEKSYKMSEQKKRIIRTLDLLVIDEMSMVRADLMDRIDDALRKYRNPRLPFGGVQLLLIGDLMQLSPVARQEEWALLRDVYATPYFFSSKALEQMRYVTVELKHIYRQQDRKFIDLLANVRNGVLSSADIDMFNSRYIPDFKAEGDGWIRLTTHNVTARRYNDDKLASIPSDYHKFSAVVEGDFPEINYPTDPELELKVGAQVMFIKNDLSGNHEYYNGKIGVITAVRESNIEVTPIEGGKAINVSRVIWENTKYTLNDQTGDIEETTVGTFKQYPLRTAWAITVHKSQGLTFDHAILDVNASFAHGQTYVALSRCRSLEGLVLSSPLSISSVITDTTVNNFINSRAAVMEQEVALLPQYKQHYALTLLDELYSLSSLVKDLEWFKRAVDEHLGRRGYKLSDSVRDTMVAFIEKGVTVAENFRRVYYAELQSSEVNIEESPLIERIKGSAKYFNDLLHNLFETLLSRAVINIENKKKAEVYNNALQQLREQVKYFMSLFSSLQTTPFSVETFLKLKAKALLNATPSSGKKRVKKNSISSGKIAEPDQSNSSVTTTVTIIEADGAQTVNIPDKSTKEKKKQQRSSLLHSSQISYDYFEQGMSVEEIAERRSLSPQTIERHLAAVAETKQIDITRIVDESTQVIIKDAVSTFEGSFLLKQLKERLPDHITYFQINLTLADMRRDG